MALLHSYEGKELVAIQLDKFYVVPRPLSYAFIFHVDVSNTNAYAVTDAEFTVVSPTVSFEDLGN